LACGSRISDTALIKYIEQENPVVSEDELITALNEEDTEIACYSCDRAYNLLVPASQWTDERDRIREQLVQHQLEIAKAADQNAQNAPTEEQKRGFRARAQRYRELAKLNKQAIDAENA
jgi:hypothetical protein